MNDIAELTLKINSLDARVAAQDLDRLKDSGKKSADSAALVEAAFAKLMHILGPAALLAAFEHAIKGAIELGDAYVRLSEIAGTTAEKIGKFDLSARLSGTSMEAVATSVARLGKSIGEARLGDVQKGGIFKALGIDVNDGRDAADVMVDVAHAVTGMKDQNVAAVVSQELLSRSFAEMRPFMKEVVEQGTLNSIMTNEQAKRAKELSDKLVKMGFEWDKLKVQLLEGLLPTFNLILESWKSMGDRGQGIKLLVEGLIMIFQALAVTGSEVAFLFNVIGVAMAYTAERIEKLKNLDWKGFRALEPQFKADVATMRTELDAWQAKVMALGTASAKAVDQVKGGAGGAGGGGKSQAEKDIAEMMEKKRTYEARIAAEKGFSDQYSEAIKLTNALAEEANKQGLLSDRDLIVQLGANEEAKLKVLKQSLMNQEAIHREQGAKGKEAETQQAIAQVNVQLVANEALTNAKLATLMAARVREYEKWRQGVMEQGQSVAESLLSSAEQENLSYQKRRDALEVYISDNIEQIVNANALREALEIDHQAKLGDLQAQGQQQRMRIEQMSVREQAEFYFGELEKITASAAQHNKAMFELNKVAAMANTIMSTYTGATKALEWGWPLGPIFAGIIIAAGLANLQAISQTRFGSTSSAPSQGAGSAVPVVPASTTTSAASTGSNGSSRTTVIQFRGTQDEQKLMRRFVDTLNEHNADGGKIFTVE